MRELPGFVIRAIPRTKKNSQRIVSMGKRCHVCGKRGGFPKVLPSLAYEEWLSAAQGQLNVIKQRLTAWGAVLPIEAPVGIEAHIYRDRNVGDLSNFLEAIGDMLQAAGIIKDDRQIEDWDGSRRLKDADNPRVEVFLTILSDQPVQESLP